MINYNINEVRTLDCYLYAEVLFDNLYGVGVVSSSFFGSNFVLAKLSLGRILVCGMELKGVHFLEFKDVLFLW